MHAIQLHLIFFRYSAESSEIKTRSSTANNSRVNSVGYNATGTGIRIHDIYASG